MARERDANGRTKPKGSIPYTGEPPVGEPFITEDGTPICGALIRNSDPPIRCEQKKGFLKENGRCSHHGGHTPPKPAASIDKLPSQWRKCLPKRLQEGFDAGQDDRHLESLPAKLSILDSLLMSKLADLGETTGVQRWSELKRLAKTIEASLPKEASMVLKTTVGKLVETIREGAMNGALELDIRNIIQEATSVSKVELQRIQLLGQFMPANQVNMLIAALSASVTNNVKDADIRRKIQSDFIRILGQPAPQVLPGALDEVLEGEVVANS